MLPDIRFVFGALTIIAMTGMIAVGLFVSARLFQQAKMGPLESSRNLAFTDSAEWNQFHDAGSVRRYIGLGPQSNPREIADAPPEDRIKDTVPAALAVDLAPVDVAHDDGAEVWTLSARPPIADASATNPVRPLETTAPLMPDQAREPSAAERTEVHNPKAVLDARPDPDQTIAAPVEPIPIHSVPPAPKEVTTAPVPELSEKAPAGATVIEVEKGPDMALGAIDGGASDRGAATGRIGPSSPASPDETARPSQEALPVTTPHPPAAVAKPAAPAPVSRTSVRRTARDDDEEDKRLRVHVSPRPRTPASRTRTVRRTYAPQQNGTQRVDRRRFPSGQPVFGPNFPYATPNSRQPVFGPHFPYATPQARR